MRERFPRSRIPPGNINAAQLPEECGRKFPGNFRGRGSLYETPKPQTPLDAWRSSPPFFPGLCSWETKQIILAGYLNLNY